MSTKAYVINSLSQTLGITKKAAGHIFEAMSAVTMGSLKETGIAVVPGIGRLKAKEKPARQGRNPRTGAPVAIPDRKVIKITPSKAAKLTINS